MKTNICIKCKKVLKTPNGLASHKKFCIGPRYCRYCGKQLSNNQATYCSMRCSARVTSKGRNHSLKTKEKISKSLLGHKQSIETKKKISKKLKGTKPSDETKKKMSESKKGKVPWNKGKSDIFSDEAIKKISEFQKNKYISNHTRMKIRKANIGKKFSLEHKKKISESNKGRISWCKGKKNIHTKEGLKKISRSHKLTISKIKVKYLFFSKVEKMRYNPNKPGEFEIQVHCKNHLCPNSKEQGGWFTPTRTQLYERIRQLEQKNGTEGSYFYCSGKCKNICPLYNLRSDPYQDTEKLNSSLEYKTFRDYVLERDNSKCQFCGKPAKHVHHERPKKLEPFFALDPDFAWSCCEKCHYEKGHKDECSTGNLSKKVC